MRGFLLSLAFVGLVLLAFNPHFVVRVQNALRVSSDPLLDSRETSTPVVEIVETNIPAIQEDRPSVDKPEVPSAEVTPKPKLDAPEFILPDLNSGEMGIPKIDVPEVNSPTEETPSISPPDAVVSIEPILTRIPRPILPTTATPDINNLPSIQGLDQFAEDKRWIGDGPCRVDMFKAPLTLRGVGVRQDDGILTDQAESMDTPDFMYQPIYLFKSERGISLRLVEPVVKYYDVTGRRFRDAERDISNRNPLDGLENIGGEPVQKTPIEKPPDSDGNIYTLANILSPSSLSFMTYGSGDDYRLLDDKTVLTSAFIVTLPRWKTYETASSDDKAEWDDLFCKAAHHELGHLRIRLDIFSETLDGYADMPTGLSRPELERLTIAYKRDINARINERQDAYHIYNGGGLRRGMNELPYAELPFPWLEIEESRAVAN